jgi:uncharacterized protein YndB with AHSA1/START domain
MVVVTRSIRINAPVERVFALVADPAARSALSPAAQPIRVEIEGGKPLGPGSICHFRLRSGNRILDYRTRVETFEPLRRILSVSDSATPFRVCIETEPDAGGTRLTQTESFEPTDAQLEQALSRSLLHQALRLAYRMLLWADTDSARRLRDEQEKALARALEPDMDRWLSAIKTHLETA